MLRESLKGLESWALGQDSENDFQDTLKQHGMGAPPSATVRKVAFRRLLLQRRQENTTALVAEGTIAATAVAVRAA